MRKILSVFGLLVGVGYLSSCGNSKSSEEAVNAPKNTIEQQADGTISLNIEKADCYSDMNNPSGNTAEWYVNVSKSGRYDVWISSATKDTNSLNYKDKIQISVHDYRLEGEPGCDRIISNSADVSYPFFRADSFIGSMFIQDTGEFDIQVISEKIVPKEIINQASPDISRLLSVSFKPVKR
jgi:hypothetical protein